MEGGKKGFIFKLFRRDEERKLSSDQSCGGSSNNERSPKGKRVSEQHLVIGPRHTASPRVILSLLLTLEDKCYYRNHWIFLICEILSDSESLRNHICPYKCPELTVFTYCPHPASKMMKSWAIWKKGGYYI